MGYTVGRKLTDELLFSIAKKYKTKGEFQKLDPSAYKTARDKNILDIITRHMDNISFSIPQLICREILDKLLKSKSLYNTRKIITPYEIDIYYPDLNLAIEYHGKGWHNSEDAIKRDELKKTLLSDKGIFLVSIIENSRDYEVDIKKQLSENKEFLDKTSLLSENIQNCKIDWHRIYSATSMNTKIDKINLVIKNCESAKFFRENFPKEYSFIIDYKLYHMLIPLKKMHDTYTDEDLKKAASNFTKYSDFVKSKYYIVCYRRGLLSTVTTHMDKKHSWKDIDNVQIIQMVKNMKCKYSSDLKSQFPELHSEIKKRKLGIWDGSRKLKNDPTVVRAQIELLLAQGITMGQIKKSNKRLYSSYFFNKKKGNYEDKERDYECTA